MHRHLRTTFTAAAVMLAAGLIASTAATASDAKRPVATDFSSVVAKKTVIIKKTTIIAPRRVGPVRVAPRLVGPARIGPRVGPARIVGPVVGPRRVFFSRPLILGGRNYSVVRGPRWVMWRGSRRNLVPLAALGLITVGAVSYAAYGYVPTEQQYCSGPTPEGCELRWQEVPTAEGDVVPQCVAFCPQQ